MLSIEECRRLLGESCPMSDKELTQVRDQLYLIADLAIDLVGYAAES